MMYERGADQRRAATNRLDTCGLSMSGSIISQPITSGEKRFEFTTVSISSEWRSYSKYGVRDG